MSTPCPLLPLTNGSAIPWRQIPQLSVEELLTALDSALVRGARLASFHAIPEADGFSIVAALAFDADNLLVLGRSTPTHGGFPSLTPRHPQAHLFEREIHEQTGLCPVGHPWLKPLRASTGEAPASAEFFRVNGPEIHEVAVGPVHAGVIEPGHFRFQCAGEEVLHLEIALGYQHRGIESALRGGPHPASRLQIEAAAGDSSIAHATAHAMALESLSGIEAPLQAQWIRAIALELERLANHTGDIGALAGDVAFLPTQSANGKLRGDYLNLTALLCGNRFGRGLVLPGGVRYDLESARAETLKERLETALADTARANAWFWEAPSVRARFEGVGVVSDLQARAAGLVGPSARACGLPRDVRADHPAGWHRFAQIPVAVWPGGDIHARARVRGLEIERSGEWLRTQLAAPPGGPLLEPLPPLPPDTFAVSLVEGWRGEVCHCVLTDALGRFRHYKITDPSFHNWTALALALRGTDISDFPLCNKSFNLSYCGVDL